MGVLVDEHDRAPLHLSRPQAFLGGVEENIAAGRARTRFDQRIAGAAGGRHARRRGGQLDVADDVELFKERL